MHVSFVAVEIIPVPDLRPKLYSVLRWKGVEKRAKRILGGTLLNFTVIPIPIFPIIEIRE